MGCYPPTGREHRDMTVYVDDSFIPAKVGSISSRWCHLFADSQEELHEFAQSIGLKRSWFQPGKPLKGGRPSHLWHYDVTEGKRAEAIRAGAEAVTWRESVKIIAARLLREKEADNGQPEL